MMRRRSLARFAAIAVTAIAAFGCSTDSPIAPKADSQAPQANLLGDLVGGLLGTKATTITPIQRITPLGANITVSKTIGLLGGTLTIPQSGLVVVVPPLAVTKPTNFKITARAGTALAYDFEPHGIRFTTPLVMTQDLTIAKVNRQLLDLGLSLGYYPDSNHVTSVTELLDVHVNLLGTTAVSTVWHFSGYIYASGRSDADSGSDSAY